MQDLIRLILALLGFGNLIFGGIFVAQLAKLSFFKKHRELSIISLSLLTFIISYVWGAHIASFITMLIQFNEMFQSQLFSDFFWLYLQNQTIETHPAVIELRVNARYFYGIPNQFVWLYMIFPTMSCTLTTWFITRERSTSTETWTDDPRKKKKH